MGATETGGQVENRRDALFAGTGETRCLPIAILPIASTNSYTHLGILYTGGLKNFKKSILRQGHAEFF